MKIAKYGFASNHWLWICLILATLFSAAVLLYWGWSWTSALAIILVAVCPAIMIWGALQIRKPLSTDANARRDRNN